MKQAIDARDQIEEKIVERRMEELLDLNLEWTQSETKPLLTEPIVAPRRVPVPVSAIPNKQTHSSKLFEVSDSSFMPVKVGEPIQVLAPDDLGNQIATMLNKKTAKLLRQDAMETTINQQSTLRVGATFEAPSLTLPPKVDLEPYTIIQITPRVQGTLNSAGTRELRVVASSKCNSPSNHRR